MLNVFSKKKRLKIGDYSLYLDLSMPHEKKYFEAVENEDYLIAKSLMKNGDKVLDLGANIGFTALLYLSFGATEVYAFEPVSKLVKRINDIKSNQIKLFDYALADYTGFGEIYLSSEHNQGHSLNDSWPERFSNVFKQKKREKVKVTTLDTILSNEIFDFIKIDVEGMEEKTILGGEFFFSQNKGAIVQIEIYDWQFEKTHDLLSKYYNYAYIPIFESGKIQKFKNLDTFKSLKEIKFSGPPNYIYTNSSSLIINS